MPIEQPDTTTTQFLREQMPVTEAYAYFDHAAVAPLPVSAAEAIRQYANEAEAQGDVGWPNWSAEIGLLRENAAKLLSAKVTEIALVNNTTQGINLIAEGLPWKPGDNVVVPDNEFPSNLLPWRNLHRYGVQIREVQTAPSGEVVTSELANAIDARTRLLAISWVGFSSGYRLDVNKVVELARARGCLVLLDAIQGLGAFPLSVAETDVDFLCADGHKWMLGPEGAGLLYVKEEHLDLLTPLGIGWNSLSSGAFDSSSNEIKHSAARYEGGTYGVACMLGFGASLRLLLEMGAHLQNSPLAEAVLSNVADLDRQLVEAGFVTSLPADVQQRSGIVGITWPGADDHVYAAARKRLLNQKLVTSVRGGRLRASPHAYNNMEDNLRLVDALREFRDSI